MTNDDSSTARTNGAGRRRRRHDPPSGQAELAGLWDPPSAADHAEVVGAAEHTVADDTARRRAWVREQQLVAAIERLAPGFHRVTGNPARYIAEATDASRDEWEWIANYIQQHPEVLTGPERPDKQWRDLYQQWAHDAYTRADAAFRAGDYAAALDHIDQAEVYQPEGWALTGQPLVAWDELREHIRSEQGRHGQTPAGRMSSAVSASRPSPAGTAAAAQTTRSSSASAHQPHFRPSAQTHSTRRQSRYS